MKRLLPLASLVLAAAAVAAELPEAWRNWRYSAPITMPQTEGSLVGVEVTSYVTARARHDLSDLRVSDDLAREVPYVLGARHDKRARERRDALLLEVTRKPGEGTQAIVDLGENPPIHNSIEIFSDETDFFAWVELGISSDAKDWRILVDRAPIYRFRKDKLEGNQIISYSPSSSRYLRPRVLEAEKRFALRGVRVAHEVVEEAERQPFDASLRRDSSAPAQQSWWLADLGQAQQPVSEARFDVSDPEFYRAVRVLASEDRAKWRTAGSGEIYRIRPSNSADPLREKLGVTFPETQARYFRVEVFDRGDPELSAAAVVRLFAAPRRVVFRAEPDRSYRLLYGNSRAAVPQYNLARLIDAAALEAAIPVSIGAEEENAAYEDAAPWSERHAVLLWVVLGVAVLVVGSFAIRALRTAR